MSELQNHKKQNKEMMGLAISKALLVVTVIILGVAATVGWLSQEAEAAKCLDCDLRQEPSYGSPSCETRCVIADEPFFCPDCITRPMPGLLTN